MSTKIKPLAKYIEDAEKRYIIFTLNYKKYNVSEAAKSLGIERRTMYNKLKELNINHRDKEKICKNNVTPEILSAIAEIALNEYAIDIEYLRGDVISNDAHKIKEFIYIYMFEELKITQENIALYFNKMKRTVRKNICRVRDEIAVHKILRLEYTEFCEKVNRSLKINTHEQI